MSVRAALVLGLFLLAAAFVHGGIWAAGHDFIVNRFTGTYEFVPADEYDDETDTHHVAMSHARAPRARRQRLDLFRTGG
jgi:hypothetical protein